MQTNHSLRYGNGLLKTLRLSDALEKGGPRSGNWGHAGRPGQIGGSLPQGSEPLTSAQRAEFASANVPGGNLSKYVSPRFKMSSEYDGLKPAEKEAVLKSAVSRHKSAYTRVGDLPASTSAEVRKANSTIGALEAIRSNTLKHLATTTDPTEQRKIMHAAIKLQELHGRAVGVRNDMIARGIPGAEVRVSKRENVAAYTTPTGTLRSAAYDQASKEVKKSVLETAAADFKSRYVRVDALPDSASVIAIKSNRAVGGMEAVRSSMIAKANSETDDTIKRKLLHSVFNLQRDIDRHAKVRDNALGAKTQAAATVAPKPEASKPAPVAEKAPRTGTPGQQSHEDLRIRNAEASGKFDQVMTQRLKAMTDPVKLQNFASALDHTNHPEMAAKVREKSGGGSAPTAAAAFATATKPEAPKAPEAGGQVKVKQPAGLYSDGNAFAILGKMQAALQAAGHPEAAKAYIAEATKGDYTHLLGVTQKYIAGSGEKATPNPAVAARSASAAAGKIPEGAHPQYGKFKGGSGHWTASDGTRVAAVSSANESGILEFDAAGKRTIVAQEPNGQGGDADREGLSNRERKDLMNATAQYLADVMMETYGIKAPKSAFY